MRTRIIAVVVAAVLAVAGAVVLVTALRTGTAPAASGPTQTVLVVTTEIPAGTAGSAIGGSVTTRSIPSNYVVTGAVASLADLSGLVASTTLEPGEQVLASRFSTTQKLASTGVHVAVPTGMQEVSIAVDLQRIAGGSVGPGDHVGVFASFTDATGKSSTRMLLDKVLLTSVNGAAGTATTAGSGLAGTTNASSTQPTSGLVLVTLAVTADQAQQVVYAAEFGKVWMSAQNDASTGTTAGPVTNASVG